MRKLIAAIVLALPFTGVHAQTPSQIAKVEAQKIGKLKNLYKIDEGIYRSAQPGSTDFGLFDKNGIKEVLNLRRLKDDKKKARKTSLTLHHISMKAGAINNNDVAKALKLIKERKGPMLIHCWHGSDRTGMLCAMYRIVFQGWEKEEAIAEMTKGNFGFHSTYSNIIDYVRTADIEKIKKELFGATKLASSTSADTSTAIISTIQ